MIIGITGIRDIEVNSHWSVGGEMAAIVGNNDVSEVWFGGARGSDELALLSAWQARGEYKKPVLKVVVPFTVDDQPVSARTAIEQYADEIIELKLQKTKSGYMVRNKYIVDHCDQLVAFWDGEAGGTRETIELAKTAGKPVRIISVRRVIKEG
jgi:uncharacterized phage-like protein YoqJ